MAHLYSVHGIQPSAKHVEAVNAFQTPTNAAEVRSFLGLASLLRKFISNMSTISTPLRLLVKKGATWRWGPTEQQAFDSIKQEMQKDTILAFFDQSRQSHVFVDASPHGLGAILAQQQSDGSMRPISFASRCLSPTEQRYSQTEREALAIKFGCLRFRHYLLRDPHFKIHTDHKPLLQLFKPGSNPPPRIMRMVLRLQDFTFEVCYTPGPENPADVLSRQPQPLPDLPNTGEDLDKEFVAAILETSRPVALTLDDIHKATKSDVHLQAALSSLKTGKWEESDNVMRSLFSVRNELSDANGILLRGQRIVCPESLQLKMIGLAHKGHQGIVRTLDRLNTKVWWPRMSYQVKQYVQQCLPCQVTNSSNSPSATTCRPNPAASRAWQKISMDLCGPLPSGESFLVIIDLFSRFPEVHILKRTTSNAIIPYVRQAFARYGIPEEVLSDNGTQFVSTEFEQFLHSYGVRHRKSIPCWPQANGEVERFNRTMMKVVRAAHVEGRDRVEALDEWLMAYRHTKHPATGVSPAVALSSRCYCDGIPSFAKSSPLADFVSTREKEFRSRKCAEANDDRSAKPHLLRVGDTVLRKTEQRNNKLTLPWDQEPWTVKEINNDSITINNKDGVTSTRHASFLKPLKLGDNQGNVTDSPEKCESKELNDSCDDIPDSVPLDNQDEPGQVPSKESSMVGCEDSVAFPGSALREPIARSVKKYINYKKFL